MTKQQNREDKGSIEEQCLKNGAYINCPCESYGIHLEIYFAFRF